MRPGLCALTRATYSAVVPPSGMCAEVHSGSARFLRDNGSRNKRAFSSNMPPPDCRPAQHR